ncbi:MAG: glycosyltransferase 87 family protein [Candidatus Latescibacterota bacterium]|nr:glycosyltransferase 87 family protein [Candidatus Latescibacterota bacterium]
MSTAGSIRSVSLRGGIVAIAAGGIIEISFLWIASLGDLALHLSELALGVGTVLSGYLLATWSLHRYGVPPLILFAFAVAFRLTLLPTTPSLSDDIYRYLWDGKVQSVGINPYVYAPDAPEVEHLRDETWERVNHRQVLTVYPPVAQALFRLIAALGGTVFVAKAVFTLCDLLLCWGLWRLLQLRGLNSDRTLLYAWHPLPVLEISGSGHMDSLAIALMIWSFVLLGQGRPHIAVVALGGAAMSKLLPLLALPAWWRQLEPSDRGLPRWVDPRSRAPLLWLTGLCGLCYLLFYDVGVELFAGLTTYAQKWRFNDSVHSLLYELLRDPSLEWDDGALGDARRIGAGLLLAWIVWDTWRHSDAAVLTGRALTTYLLLSPTVHPWYLLWALPFVCLSPLRPVLVWSFLCLLAYEVLAGYRVHRVWEPAAWVPWAEYGPVAILLIHAAWSDIRKRNAGAV